MSADRCPSCGAYGNGPYETDPARTGYEATVLPDSVYDGMEVYTRCWRVRLLRLSDGEQRTRTFHWRWRARRFATSRRRIRKAFEREAIRRPDEVETYVIEWETSGAKSDKDAP